MKNVIFTLIFALLGAFALCASPPELKPIKDQLCYHSDSIENSAAINVDKLFTFDAVGETNLRTCYLGKSIWKYNNSFEKHSISATEVSRRFEYRCHKNLSFISNKVNFKHYSSRILESKPIRCAYKLNCSYRLC